MSLRGEVRNAEALGLMLQQARLLRGLTQRQLAEDLGISQRYVWEMENGKPSIFTDRLFQMMRATGMRLHAELDDEPPASTPTGRVDKAAVQGSTITHDPRAASAHD